MLCNLMYVHVGKPPPSNTSGRAQFKLGSDLESKRTLSIRSGEEKLPAGQSLGSPPLFGWGCGLGLGVWAYA